MARVMLATPDDMMRRYLGEKLKRVGHFVTRVADLDVAMTILCESAHDILLVSVEEDESVGLNFAHEARRLDPDMGVMFITGFALVPLIMRDDDEDGLFDRLGAPAHLNQLVLEVGRMLAA